MFFAHMRPLSTREQAKLLSHVKIRLSRVALPTEIVSINDVWTLVFLQQNLASSHPMVIIGCHSLRIFLTIATLICLLVLFEGLLQQKKFTPLHYIPFSLQIT